MQKYCFHLILILGLSDFVFPGNVIYHQTMTPNWLEMHASYIDSARTSTTKQLTFNSGSVSYAALLKVPLISPGVIKVLTPLTVEIVVANDVSIGKNEDSDTRYGLSDGEKFVGFHTLDKNNYWGSAPCYGSEGIPGKTISEPTRQDGVPSGTGVSVYPGMFVFTLKLNERWGSCYTAHDGGLVRTFGFNNRLMLDKGLTLEVYKEDSGERVGIKFIKVTIIQDDV